MIPSNCRIPPGVRVRLRKLAQCITGSLAGRRVCFLRGLFRGTLGYSLKSYLE